MNKLPDGWLAVLFEHGLDLPNRRVFLGEITDESALKATQGFYALETQSDTEPIDLFINSPGGDIAACLCIHDIIQTLNCPVRTFASGSCMSAAPLLLAAGEPGHRYVSPHVQLMTHQWSAEFEGKSKHIKADLKYTEKLDNTWLEIFANLTGKSIKFWKGLSNRDYDFYFGSQEALDWGVADFVWAEK